MESSLSGIASWIFIISLLDGLFLLGNITALLDCSPDPPCAEVPTVNKYLTQPCSADLLYDRHIVLGPTDAVNEIWCANTCASDTSCGVAVSQTFPDGLVTCILLSHKDFGLESTLNVSKSRTCEATVINHCKNGGYMEEGACVCVKGFTGEFCKSVQPPACVSKSTRIFSYDKSTGQPTVHNPTLLNYMKYFTPKIRSRNDDLALWQVGQVSRVDKSKLSMHATLPKQSFDTFKTNAARTFHVHISFQFLYDIGFGGGMYKKKFAILDPPTFEIWTAEATPYLKNIQVSPQNIDEIKKNIQCGNTLIDSNSMSDLGNDVAVSYIQLAMIYGSETKPTYWWESKFTFNLSKFATRPVLGFNGAINFITNQPSSPFVTFVNPCWFPLESFPVKDNWKLKQKVMSYLNRGKDVRVMVDRIYVDVLEVIKEGEEIHAVLAPMTSSPGADPFDSTTRGLRSFVSSEGELAYSFHVMESEIIVASGKTSGAKVKWFFDADEWAEVYSVYTNGTIAKGQVLVLWDAVNTASTVRIRLRWQEESRVRYLATVSSTVTDAGKVSSETVTTWMRDYSNSPTLEFNKGCALEKILVSSDGRIEDACYDIFSASVSQVLTDDILITWFVNG